MTCAQRSIPSTIQTLVAAPFPRGTRCHEAVQPSIHDLNRIVCWRHRQRTVIGPSWTSIGQTPAVDGSRNRYFLERCFRQGKVDFLRHHYLWFPAVLACRVPSWPCRAIPTGDPLHLRFHRHLLVHAVTCSQLGEVAVSSVTPNEMIAASSLAASVDELAPTRLL
jgi:hypothetical protein